MGKNRIYYVYLLINPLDMEVFYVGKGFGNRMYRHQSKVLCGTHYNKPLTSKITSILQAGKKVSYKKVFESYIEEEALEQERKYIDLFGIDNLCNYTSGGQGSSGYKHTEQARKKMSAFQSTKKLTEQHKQNISKNHPFKGEKRLSHSLVMSGEGNPRAKLNWDKVKDIRSVYLTGNTSYSILAKKYNVDKSVIADIIHNRIWKL